MSKQRRVDDPAWRLDEILSWRAFGNLDLDGSYNRARRQWLYGQSPSSELMRFEDEGGAMAREPREPRNPLAVLPEAENDLYRKLIDGDLVLFDADGNDMPSKYWAAHHPRHNEVWLGNYRGWKKDVLRLWPPRWSTIGDKTASAPPTPAAAAPDLAAPSTQQPITEHIQNTGLPGRPAKSWHLIEPECRRRFATGEQHGTTAEWARTLIEWLKIDYPTAAVPKQKTLSNKLNPLLRELKREVNLA